MWRERFGADPSVVGRTIALECCPTMVVGMAPHGIVIPHGAQLLRADLWVPMRFSERERAIRRSNFLPVLGRLAPGAALAAADAVLSQRFRGITEQHPQLRGEGVRIMSMRSEGARTVRRPLLLLFAAVL